MGEQSIPRYDVTGTGAGMTPTHHGDYVCYDDFAKLERELAAEKARADANAHQSLVNAQAADNWRNEAAQLQERLTSEWAVAIERDAALAQVATLRDALGGMMQTAAIHGASDAELAIGHAALAAPSGSSTPETKHPDTERFSILAEALGDTCIGDIDPTQYFANEGNWTEAWRAALDVWSPRKATP